MKQFQVCLREQLTRHPSMEARDVVKLCYQAACGAEHLLSDPVGALAYFQAEYAAVQPNDEPLYEPISESICRVNLRAWKRMDLPAEWLFQMFSRTVFFADGKNRLRKYLEAASETLAEQSFDMTAWEEYLAEYARVGMPSVRHSEAYRKAEEPAYRIVNMVYLSAIQDKTE